MLNLVLITYNDMPLVQKCIESCIEYVDRLIVVDGVFRDFPQGDKPYSTDGTFEYIIGLNCAAEKEVLVIPGLTEVEKRNQYLIGDPGDWYLHLDADEWVKNPEVLKELPEDADVAWCEMHWTNGFHRYARLFRAVDGLHYRGLHYRLVDGDNNLVADIENTGDKYRRTPFPLCIWHDKDLRDADRQRRKKAYYKVLTAQEHEVKEALRFGLDVA